MSMLIGAHVSPAGGPANAVGRGVDLGCTSIQIFNQSPRMWRGRLYTEDEAAAFREAMAASPIRSVVIHAVYLINCASDDPEIRDKSRAALTLALQAGDQLGADGVVVHPGSAKTGHVGEAIARAGAVLREALAESESCPLLLEDTAGAGGTLGRSFDELAELLDAAGSGPRLGLCLDSCHLYASGLDVRTEEALAVVLDECDAKIGLERLRCLHINDSKSPFASNTDRHAPLGAGELGPQGCAVFLSEPRFEGLPAIFEGPGVGGKGAERTDIDLLKKYRRAGLRRR